MKAFCCGSDAQKLQFIQKGSWNATIAQLSSISLANTC